MSKKQPICILLVEDNALDRKAVERSFMKEKLPYKLEFAETLATAKERLGQGGLDLLLIDQSLPDGTGLEFQKQLEDIPSIFLTGSGDTNTAVQAMKAGAYDYLVKDTARDYLLLLPVTIEKALKRKRDEDELTRYRLHLEEEVQLRTVELQKANEQLSIEIAERVQTEKALHALATTFTASSGEEFFIRVSRHITVTLGVDYAFIGELVENDDKIHVLGGFGKGKELEPFDYDLAGTPCENVIGQTICAYPSGVQEQFPKDYLLVEMSIDGYVGSPIFGKSGQPLGIMVLLDSKPITNQKLIESMLQIFVERVSAEIERGQAETALRESEQQLSLIYASVGDVLFHIAVEPDDCFRFLSINQAFLDNTGLAEGQIVGKRIEEVIPEPAVWMVRDNYKKAIDEKRIVRWEETSDYPAGERVGDVSIVPVRNEEGICTHLVGSVHDITERVQAEEALLESEARFKEIAEAIDEVFTISDAQSWSVLYASPAYEQIWGRSVQELYKDAGQWDEGIHPDDLVRMQESWTRMLEDGVRYDEEHRVIRPDGSMRWVRSEHYPIRDESGQVYRIAGIVQDITARKQLEAELVLERNKFNFILQELPIGVSVLDADHKFIYINPISVQLDGYPKDLQSILGEHILKVHPKQKQSKVEQLLRDFVSGEKTVYARETKRGKRTLEIAYHALHDAKDKYLGLVRLVSDISERVQAEEEKQQIEVHLRQQQKLESLGTLASGVAHEINNPITGIMNYAQLISERLDPAQSQLREFADGIGQETERVAGIVRNLLSFARQEKQSHSPARIVDIVNETLLLVRTVIRRDQITLEMDVPDELPKIKCRSQQIQQVLMNLLTNSRDALNERYPEHDPNKIIKVTVRPFENEGRHWLRTTVEDHGAGIPAAIRERVFDPFYTTKDRSKGTGLGLSISRGIVQEHHGELSFECVENQSTRFYLDLPVDNGWDL